MKVRKNSYLYKLQVKEMNSSKLKEPYKCPKCNAPFTKTQKKYYDLHIERCNGK